MCEKVNFNVIEKINHQNEKEIANYISIIVNKLIAKEFARGVEWYYSVLYNTVIQNE